MHTSEELSVSDSAQFKDENGHDGKKENGRCQSQLFVLAVLQAQFVEGFMGRHESCSSVT